MRAISHPSPKILVVLPGLDGTGDLITEFVSTLPTGLCAQVVRYPSDRFQTYPELLAHLADSVPRADSFVVIAESFSSPLGVMLAATRPPNLAGLVICAGFVTSPVGRWLRGIGTLLHPSLFRIPLPGFVIDHFLIGANPPNELRKAVRGTVRSVSPEVMALRVRAVMNCDARDDLALVQVPILYLQATADRLVRGICFEQIRQLKPDTTLASVAAPHFVLQREPRKAADLIVRFLESLPVNIKQ